MRVITEQDRERAAEWIKSAYEPKGEDARRIARYAEAVRLLREAREGSDLISFSLTDRIEAFLAAGAEGRGG